MRLVERFNTAATTTLTFTAGAPRQPWNDIYRAMISRTGSYVVVFDQEPASLPNGRPGLDLLDRARWIGRPIRAFANGFELMTVNGLYDVPGHNVAMLTRQTIDDNVEWLWPNILEGFAPFGHIAHTRTIPAGKWKPGATIAGTPTLDLFAAAAEHFDVVWKLDRLARIHWATSTDHTQIFPSHPSFAVIDTPDAANIVNNVRLYAASFPKYAASVAHHTTLLLGVTGDSVEENFGDPVGIAPAGQKWMPSRTINLSSTSTPATARLLLAQAKPLYAPNGKARHTFDVVLNSGNSPVDIAPGDTIWAFSDTLPFDSTLPAVDVGGIGMMTPFAATVTDVDAVTHSEMCITVWEAGPKRWWRPFGEHVERGDGSVTFRLDTQPTATNGIRFTPATSILRERNHPHIS